MSKEKDSENNQEQKAKKKFDPEKEQLDIHINSFGEIISNYSVEELNAFLDDTVEDKKLKGKPKRKK